MTWVTDALREDHRNIAILLRALERQIDIFAKAEQPDYDIVVGVADYFLEYPDRCHHPKEDLILAKLKEAHPKDAASIADLIDEHVALHQQALRFREAVQALLNEADVPRSLIVDTARDFIAAQYRHMRTEEDSLFPVADRVLTPGDWAEIERRLIKGVDPVFGPWVEEMFRALSTRVLAWQAEDEKAAS